MANNPNDPKRPEPDDEKVPDSVPFDQLPPVFHPSSDEPGSVSEDELPTLPPSAGLSDPELYLRDPRVATGPQCGGLSGAIRRATHDSAVFESLKPEIVETA